jgi:hypothetical protein
MSPCILKIYVTYNTIKRFRPQVEVNFRCYIFTHAYTAVKRCNVNELSSRIFRIRFSYHDISQKH